MAFPQVAAVNGGNRYLDGTTHIIDLPSGYDTVGDLLIVVFGCDGSESVGWPAGWTELFEKQITLVLTLAVGYRVAEGDEESTITVTTGTSERSAHTSYRISGIHSSSAPECGSSNTSDGSDSPDPPDLDPSWGEEDTLWIAACCYDANKTISGYPTNYTDGRNDHSLSVAGCGVGSCFRELNAESETPPLFALSASEQWIANTLAIRCSGDGGGGFAYSQAVII